jgi:hypothetical protein
MKWLGTEGQWISETIETTLWVATWLAILVGLMYEGGRRMVVEVMGVLRGLLARTTGRRRRHLLRVPVAVVAVALVFPSLAVAGQQGWWWGSPINPGFDRSTVIRVSGTAASVTLEARSGPATLSLECPRDTYTVILGPGWYLAQLSPDIREGDPLTVEGSKMMDRRGSLHLVAARVTNERTGVVLELRDEVGHPRWMGGPTPGRLVR